MIKIVAGQGCGTKNILVKGLRVQMPHVRSAATGHCNAESLSFPWFLLAVVTWDLMTPLEGSVQSRTLLGWGTSVPLVDWSILIHIPLKRKGTGTL